MSVYIKNISSASNIFLGIVSNPYDATLNFDATSGTIIGTGGSITSSSVTSVGSGWYRLSGTYISTGTSTAFAVYGMGTMSFAAWGAQLETGVTTAYIATTSSAVSVGPVANVPRLDYLGSTCGKLILEPQRTNVQINSENFSALAYENGTITSNNTTSPDGYVNADLYTENTTNSYHRINVGGQTYTSGTAYTFSVFAKANGTGRYLCVNAQSAFNARTFFNLNTGVISLTELGSATITNYGNGWYRCTVTGTRTSGTSSDSMYFGLTTGLADLNYTGNGTNGFWGWGIQIENSASYATSYIPTLGAAVTRGQDVTSKSGISSLIGQTNGSAQMTFVMDSDTSADSTTMLGIHASTSTANRIQLLSRFGTVVCWLLQIIQL